MYSRSGDIPTTAGVYSPDANVGLMGVLGEEGGKYPSLNPALVVVLPPVTVLFVLRYEAEL